MQSLVYPPGPRESVPGILLLKFRRDPIRTLTSLASEYGDIAHFKVGRRHVYLLTNPDSIKEVLVTSHMNFIKGQRSDPGLRFLGDGLLTSDGALHNRRRRTVQPAFDHSRVFSYGQVMAEIASSAVEGWKDGDELEVYEEMTKLTLRTVARTLLGSDLRLEAADIVAALTIGMESFGRMTNPATGLLDKLPMPSNRRFKEAEKRLNSTIFKIIGLRRAGGEEKDDLLSMLIHAKDEDGSTMTDSQLRDEVMTMFLSGFETMSNLLTWTWYLLSQNPAAERKLHAELDRVLSGRPPNAGDIHELRYAVMVLTETMRLYPPAWLLFRKAAKTCAIQGYPVPKGSVVLMSQYTIFHDHRYFLEPEAFRPERWTPEVHDSLRKRFVYSPFGGGPRGCIGEPFAWMEGILFVATIAQKWKLHLKVGHPVVLSPGFSLRPKNGVRMILERRD